MPRNRKWARDELILALDLYFRVDAANSNGVNEAEIENLTRLLDSLPIGHAPIHTEDVVLKLRNFLRFDPAYEGTELSTPGEGDVAVWALFGRDPDRLERTAASIRKHATADPMRGADLEEETEFAEGRILTRVHLARERNATLTATKKSLVLKQTGRLACEACGFDFREVYGPLGEGFTECHHTGPVAAPAAATNTRLTDLAIVCANCHRMLHRLMARDPRLHTPADLRNLLSEP